MLPSLTVSPAPAVAPVPAAWVTRPPAVGRPRPRGALAVAAPQSATSPVGLRVRDAWQLLDAAGLALCLFDANGALLRSNDRWRSAFGDSEAALDRTLTADSLRALAAARSALTRAEAGTVTSAPLTLAVAGCGSDSLGVGPMVGRLRAWWGDEACVGVLGAFRPATPRAVAPEPSEAADAGLPPLPPFREWAARDLTLRGVGALLGWSGDPTPAAGVGEGSLDPAELAYAATRWASAAAGERNVRVRAQVAGPRRARGDGARVLHALLHTLQHAVNQAPAGGTVVVRVTATAEGGAEIAVAGDSWASWQGGVRATTPDAEPAFRCVLPPCAAAAGGPARAAA